MANYQDENNIAHNVAEPVTEYGIPVAVSDIWNAIQALSPSNKQWLRDHLIEQDDDDNTELISDEELAACYSIDEAEEQLLQMVHKHFSTRKAI